MATEYTVKGIKTEFLSIQGGGYRDNFGVHKFKISGFIEDEAERNRLIDIIKEKHQHVVDYYSERLEKFEEMPLPFDMMDDGQIRFYWTRGINNTKSGYRNLKKGDVNPMIIFNADKTDFDTTSGKLTSGTVLHIKFEFSAINIKGRVGIRMRPYVVMIVDPHFHVGGKSVAVSKFKIKKLEL